MNDNDTSNIEEEKPVSNSKTYKEYYENGQLKREKRQLMVKNMVVGKDIIQVAN